MDWPADDDDDKSGQELGNIFGIPILLSTGSDRDFSQETNSNEIIVLDSSDDEQLSTEFVFISSDENINEKKTETLNEDEYYVVEKLDEILYNTSSSTPIKSEGEMLISPKKQLTTSTSDITMPAKQEKHNLHEKNFYKSIRPKSAIPTSGQNSKDFVCEKSIFPRSNTDIMYISPRKLFLNIFDASNKPAHEETFIISPRKEDSLYPSFNKTKKDETGATSATNLVSDTDIPLGTTFTLSVKHETDIESFDKVSISQMPKSDVNEISLTPREKLLNGNEIGKAQEKQSNEAPTCRTKMSDISLKNLVDKIKKLEKEIAYIKDAHQRFKEQRQKNKETKSKTDSTRIISQCTVSSSKKNSPRKNSPQECTTTKQFEMDNAREDEQERWNKPEHEHNPSSYEELKSPRSPRSHIKYDVLGRPRFKPIFYAWPDQKRKKSFSPRQPNISQTQYIPANNDQAYIQNVQVSSQYVQQQRYVQPSQAFTPTMEPRHQGNNHPTMKQIFNRNQQNVNQYSGNNNSPPVYHDEMNSSFYDIPQELFSPNHLYQQSTPDDYEFYYSCTDNFQPVYMPQFNYFISHSTRIPHYQQHNQRNFPNRYHVPRHNQTSNNLNTNEYSPRPEYNEANFFIARRRSKSLPNCSPRSISGTKKQRKSRLDQHKKCIGQRKRELFMRQLQSHHFFEEENKYLLERKSLNNIPSTKEDIKEVDKGSNGIEPAEYQLIANMPTSQYKLRTNTILPRKKQMETYDLRNRPKKLHKSNSTQTDILDIEVPFRTIIPSKYNKNNYKLNLFKYYSTSSNISPCLDSESTFIIERHHKSEDNVTNKTTPKSRRNSVCVSNIPVPVHSSRKSAANRKSLMNTSSKKKNLNELEQQKSSIPVKTPINKCSSIPCFINKDRATRSLRASKAPCEVTKIIRRKITKPEETRDEEDDIGVSLSVQTETFVTDTSSGPKSAKFTPLENESKAGFINYDEIIRTNNKDIKAASENGEKYRVSKKYSSTLCKRISRSEDSIRRIKKIQLKPYTDILNL